MQYVFTLPEHRQSAVFAVSAFDGVHSKHQQLLAETITTAERLGVTPVALLPWPPAPTLDDPAGAGMLTTLSERIRLLERFAPTVELVLLPSEATQPWSPTTLLERMTSGWDVKCLVVDPSSDEHLCGTELADAARLYGVPVAALAREGVSATPMGARIRADLLEGRATEAARHLTYEYKLSAEVVGGDRRGRLLGFPTANLHVDAGKVIPGNGIYAVRVGLPGERDMSRPAVASIGVRPTFGTSNARLVEVYLLDLSMDLYGVRIETAFVEWLRAEERFDTVEALIRQMSADVEEARQRLAHGRRLPEGSTGSLRLAHEADAHP